MAEQPEVILRHIRKVVGDNPGEDTPDAQLLRQFATRQDEAAFAALVRRHGPMVLGLCRRLLRHAQDAEDVFQATFLVLARKAGSVRKGQSVGSFLHGVSWRLARKARAEAARWERRQSGEQPESSRPLDSLAADELLEALDEELVRLPERYRAPLVLCHLHDRTQDEAAAELGLSKATLRRRLARARALLLARLKGRGFTSPASLAAALAAASTGEAVAPALLATSLQLARSLGPADGDALPPTVAGLAAHGLRLVAAPKITAAVALAASAALLLLTTGLVAFQVRPPAARPGEAAEEKPLPGPLPRQDLFGDPLPQGALARLGTLRFRPGWYSAPIAYSLDGKLLAVGAQLWETAPIRLRHMLHGRPEVLVFSPDSKLLAVGGDEVVLQETATGKELLRLPGAANLAFSPDQKTLALARHNCVVQLYDLPGGKLRAVLDGTSKGAYWFRHFSVAFSPDGRLLASGQGPDNKVIL
jgi:RNA polymerase sigma factor (sigma-70 family)